MKKSIIFASAALFGLMTSSCADDYLDLAPQSQQTPATIFANVEAAEYAINGIGRLQSSQYFSQQGYNGEGTLCTWYGEQPGQDVNVNRWNSTWYNYANFNNAYKSGTSYMVIFPWIYNYKIIANANAIIQNIDNASGDESQKKFIKAQALVYRAHAYAYLVKLYSKRWCDSKNGTTRGVPLRLTGDEGDDLECSTVGETYAQIYADLDLAISLFNESGVDRPAGLANCWLPNVDVAHAVYSRAALNREDWNTCVEHSKEARKNYTLMDSETYREGFNTPNKEWIWEAFNDNTQPLHYYGPFAYMASNSIASVTRSYGPVISKELVDQIPENDTRLWLYGIPQEGDNNIVSTSATSSPGKVTKGGLYDRYLSTYYDRFNHEKTMVYYLYQIMKFQVVDGTSCGCWVLYRAAEMYYNEAEALMNIGGHENEAKALLNAAVAPYQDNYSCDNLSGDALMNEIKLYRRFDLLGEGHSWYDCKRWNIPMQRKSWEEGGSFPRVYCGTGESGGNYSQTDKNNWCYMIPDDETNYNKNINYGIEPENWTKGCEVNASGDSTEE